MSLRGKNLLLVGLTLFSMFFGAGNLIFPPGVAAQAGVNTWPAMAGLAVSAVGLPVLGVAAVARAGGLNALAGRVHPLFARAFAVAAYLAIGPCLAIPRTATTSFEMAAPLLAGAEVPQAALRLVWSLAFFAAALVLALRPEKLTDRLGKVLCPLLVALILTAFVACVIVPPAGYGPAEGEYLTHPVARGFLEGYQTMDAIAALAFGIIIAVNIRARGVREEAVVGGTVRAGLIAGAMLLAVYAMLAHIGACSAGAMPHPSDGARALTNAAGLLFGPAGNFLLAAIFLIACFNVCVGLISSCGAFFFSICPRLPYRAWAILFAVVSAALSNVGLTGIMALSAPVLGAIYPMAILLMALSFLPRSLAEGRRVFPVAMLFTGAASVLFALKDAGVPLGFLDALPLAGMGLGWLLPAIVGVLLGLAMPARRAAPEDHAA